MDYSFWVGILGSLFLVAGAAWPIPKKLKNPAKSTKNWLLLIWSIILFLFSWLGYYNWLSIFFLILQIMIIIAGILMMLNTNDKFDATVLSVSWLGLIIWSLYLFEWYTTLIFILWLVVLWFGYAFKTGSLRRDIALTVWSIFIAWFSILEPNWIFFGLNVFFAIFSWYYLVKNIQRSYKKK